MSVKVENLSYVYMQGTPFETLAVDNVSFEIQQGEFIAIIGHTGSGKSTLIQQLNGLLIPTSGRVEVDGYEISPEKKDLKEIRKKVGLVFQYPEYQLFEETVAKDVAFGPMNQGATEQEAEIRVKEAITDMGLDYEEVKDLSPFELSGGQKRRVAIAGVLAMNPDIIVFDEPTAGLDPRGRELLFSSINALKKKGKTIILVSHSMDDVARLADRVFVMSGNKMIFQGTPAEAFSEKNVNLELNAPQLTLLARKLNNSGKFNIPDGVFDIEDMKNVIISQLRGDSENV